MWASNREIRSRFHEATVRCTCSAAINPWDSAAMDCPVLSHREAAAKEVEALHKAEIDAENAWLRAAEAGDPQSWAEEDYERQREAFYA